MNIIAKLTRFEPDMESIFEGVGLNAAGKIIAHVTINCETDEQLITASGESHYITALVIDRISTMIDSYFDPETVEFHSETEFEI